MRHSIVNGNGFLCDICGCPLYPKEVIRIKSFIPKKNDKTGKYEILDTIGVCEDCYKQNFKIMLNRGKFREVKK